MSVSRIILKNKHDKIINFPNQTLAIKESVEFTNEEFEKFKKENPTLEKYIDKGLIELVKPEEKKEEIKTRKG